MTEPSVPAVPIMSKAKARRLLDRIKTKADSLWADLVEAHDGGAWVAVGYKSWAECAEKEFGASRTHSYRLLNQARLMGELESAAPTPEVSRARDTLSQRDVERMDTETQAGLVESFAAADSPEDAEAAVEEARRLAAEKARKAKEAKKAEAAAEVHDLTHSLTDTEWSDLLDLARKTSIDRVSLSAHLHRAAVRLALLAYDAGVAEPVRFLERDLPTFIETGEMPTVPVKANGKQRTPMRSPALEKAMAGRVAAPADGECRHVASKPKSSGLVVCELCGLPRTRWAVAVGAAGPRVERRAVDVPTAFKGSGKK